MKKSVSYFLILNLFLSIIAFGFIINISFISADLKDKETPPAAVLPTALAGTKIGEGAVKVIELTNPFEFEGYTYNAIGQKGSDYVISVKGVEKIIPSDKLVEGGILNTKGEFVKGAIEVKTTPGSSGASQFFGIPGGTYTDAIVSGAYWAIITYGIVQMVGPMFGLDDDQVDATSTAAAMGLGVGKSLYTLLGEGGRLQASSFGKWISAKFPGGVGGFSFTAGLVVAAIIFYSTYKDESQETIIFTCEPWQAPTGGANCEKCNKQGALPCSEYQCRSLGQSCELLNPGTDEESCTWVNRHDVNPPVMKPLNDALLDGYVYAPDNTISPPDKGVKVQNTKLSSKCAEAFTPLTFGIITNEPAQCRISSLRKNSFDDMALYFGGSNSFKYNHTQVMVLPGADALEAEGITINTDGNFEVFA